MSGHHSLRPVRPVPTLVFDQPQHTALVAVGVLSADLAEQPPHRPALPQAVHPAESWRARARVDEQKPFDDSPTFAVMMKPRAADE